MHLFIYTKQTQMKKKGIIIQGSSRSDGNTNMVAKFVQERTQFDFLDLKTKNIAPFDYEFKNQDDDFLPLMKDITDNYDVIIFATPVYWYSMSAILKTFFDRISDCLHLQKEIGRKLRGKSMAMISSSSGSELNGHFRMPFVESANYLGMHYLGDVHTWIEEESIPETVKQKLEQFVQTIKANS